MSNVPILNIRNLSMTYHRLNGEVKAIEKIDLDVYQGEIIGIVGPSGCGKSTLLSIIAGLLKPSSGEVILNGKKVEKPTKDIGYMFQRDLLFEWKTILENVLLGLEIQGRVTEESKKVAEKLLEKIKYPFMIEDTVLNVSANIGISRFPNDGKDAETLVRHAETAMYKSKGQLEGKIFFYSREMSEEIKERFYIVNLLTRAIANRELSVYYQPIFDINNSANIVGIEALLRWRNPILGNVVPDKFIPLAEKTGYIIYIGEWVLKEVCKQIKLWNRQDIVFCLWQLMFR